MTLLNDVWSFVAAEMRYVYIAMRYLHARDGLDFFLLLVSGLVWLRVSWRLAFPAIAVGEVVPRGANVMRTVLLASSLVLAWRIFAAHYLTPFEPAEFPPNLFVWAVVEAYRGDVTPLYEALRAAWLRTRVSRWRILSWLAAAWNHAARLRIFGGKSDGA